MWHRRVILDFFLEPSCLACGQRKYSGFWVFMHRRACLWSPHAGVFLLCRGQRKHVWFCVILARERLNLTSFPDPVALHVDRGSTVDVGFSCIGKLVCNLMLDSGCSGGDRKYSAHKKCLDRSKKLNIFFPVIHRPLKWSLLKKDCVLLYGTVFHYYKTKTFHLAAIYIKVNISHFLS